MSGFYLKKTEIHSNVSGSVIQAQIVTYNLVSMKILKNIKKENLKLVLTSQGTDGNFNSFYTKNRSFYIYQDSIHQLVL
jgi:hypothetical protein